MGVSIHMRGFAAFALLLALALPAVADAQRSNAPPGNSGVDQYRETVPQSGGNHPVDPSGKGGHGGHGGLSGQALHALRGQGADGAAAAKLAEATGPSQRHRRPAGHGTGAPRAGKGASATLDRATGGVLDALAAIVTGNGSGGMGAVLPLLFLLALAGAGAFVLVQRRRTE
jgi:hypothetical protein